MLCELRHDNSRQQIRAGATALDGLWRQWGQHDDVVPAAGQFGRTVSITLSAVLIIFSCSEMLSPSGFSLPLQTGHSISVGGDNLSVTGECYRKRFAGGSG